MRSQQLAISSTAVGIIFVGRLSEYRTSNPTLPIVERALQFAFNRYSRMSLRGREL